MSTTIESKSLITKGQIKAGRALLGWSQLDLSNFSGVSLNTIKRIESGEGKVMARLQTIEDIVGAFSSHGLMFQNEDTRIAVILRLNKDS